MLGVTHGMTLGKFGMPTIHFLGRIFPEAVNISVEHDPTVKWEAAELGLRMEFKNHIVNSKIDVECKLNRWGSEDFVPVYMRALDLCRASVDTVAFATGYGLTVYLDTFIDPAGTHSALLFKDDRLPLCALRLPSQRVLTRFIAWCFMTRHCSWLSMI